MDTPSNTVAARLTALEGDAWLRHGNERLPLTQGSALAVGDVLETGPGAEVQLHLASGHALSLGPEQWLSLDGDVLATASADTSEWRCIVESDPAIVSASPALTLDSVLDSTQGMDHWFGTGSAQGTHLPLMVLDDGGIQHLLRSLLGPEAH